MLWLVVISLIGMGTAQAHPLIDNLLQTYELVGGYDCQKPAVAPGPTGDDEQVERRFIDLDGSGMCQVMDIWYEYLDDTTSRRSPHSRLYVFQNGKWIQKGGGNPAYFPYTLRNKKTGTLYFLTAPGSEGADQAFLGDEINKFRGWTDTNPVEIVRNNSWDDPSSLTQALAVLLTKRLTPEELSQPPHRKRNLRALIARDFAHSGNMDEPPENRLPLNQYGLPDLTQ